MNRKCLRIIADKPMEIANMELHLTDKIKINYR